MDTAVSLLEEIRQTFVKRFDMVDQRFDAVDQRFDTLDQRFDAVDQRFDTLDQRFDAVDQRFAAIEQRLDMADQRFEGFDQRLEGLTHWLSSIDQRLTNVETNTEKALREITVLRSRYSTHEEYLGFVMQITGQNSGRLESFKNDIDEMEEKLWNATKNYPRAKKT